MQVLYTTQMFIFSMRMSHTIAFLLPWYQCRHEWTPANYNCRISWLMPLHLSTGSTLLPWMYFDGTRVKYGKCEARRRALNLRTPVELRLHFYRKILFAKFTRSAVVTKLVQLFSRRWKRELWQRTRERKKEPNLLQTSFFDTEELAPLLLQLNNTKGITPGKEKLVGAIFLFEQHKQKWSSHLTLY